MKAREIYNRINKVKPFWAYTIIILFTCFLLIRTFNRRLTFWDMIPYMGAVVSITEPDPAVIHRVTYASLKKCAPEPVQEIYITRHPFCLRNSIDAHYFNSQVAFFKVKWLYVYMAAVFYFIHVPLYYSVYVPVWIAAILFAVLLFNMAKVYVTQIPAVLFCCILMSFNFNRYTFGIASPDALAGLFTLAGVHYFLHKQRIYFASFFFLLAVLVRPENLIFLFVFAFIRWYSRKTIFGPIAFREILLLLVGLVSVCLAYNLTGYSSSAMFYRSFIDLMPSPEEMPQLTPGLYKQGILNGLNKSMKDYSTWVLLGLVMIYFFLKKRLSARAILIMNVFIISLCIKFLLHPLVVQRFTFVFIDVTIIVLVFNNYVMARLNLAWFGTNKKEFAEVV